MALCSDAIRNIIVCVALAWIFGLPADSTAITTQFNRRPVLLLTGDSLTEHGTYPNVQGWVALLQAQYTRTADVIARGLSGYNTRWFLKDVMPVLENEINSGAYSSPSLITVWLGTNDAALTNGSNSEMHVPIEDYKQNLIKIVGRFQSEAPNANILMITPPHIDDDARVKNAQERTDAKRGLVDRSNSAVGNYSRACVDVASTLNVPVLDLYAHFDAMTSATRNTMLIDGIHFNAAGNKVVNEQLHNKLSAEFPDLVKSLEAWQFPAVSKYVMEDPWTAKNSTETTGQHVS
ncbi:hypothetical protein F441_05856 [Phytophthora nicotianae CJ01A1]|uniref:SGNH hydrolase-type esterase domain-containing protein n=4 Tax=Phytophthora nicotianae TaxID=4792 RepID=W2ZN42_PHYNI|nr:hypothetical protein L915_05718 [Phytophthora nicotianae]ETL43956.1 hypothetical protein L916_05655 [Phytophthora nicotianae]ETO79402.1 hypothetical protein F444_05899 [Phytophthora nicotianae P1976]ETP20500.1 hypothetical protein F441_05856 [Phytophthora nicotianae CJ01A1]ETP48391.1 hypothetical protein F442_05894 [Phytophthora nicotianae P10297]